MKLLLFEGNFVLELAQKCSKARVSPNQSDTSPRPIVSYGMAEEFGEEGASRRAELELRVRLVSYHALLCFSLSCACGR